MKIREEIINSIHSMNKQYSWEWLEKQEDEILINISHPLYREEFEYRLKKEKENSEYGEE